MSELICAIATPPRPSAIGILRLSGTGAVAAVDSLFTPDRGGSLAQCPPGKLTLGLLRDEQGRPLDQIQAVRYVSGYTGEESAELFCHGSPVVLTLAMEALCARGARPAQPGEFTKRAFLSGKLDLPAAEAVMDLIDAETPAAARCALGQLSGALSRRVEGIYSRLIDVMAHFHAVLDYPDEDIDPFRLEELLGQLQGAQVDLNALVASYDRGRVVARGVPCAIVGRPNVGKSTLLNALVGYERAIVTDIPGTTRDTVEERCVLGGVLLRLIDTAGLRDTADPVERMGVERSRRAMEEAGLILMVMDQSRPATEEEFDLLRQAMDIAPTILIWNKGDLPPAPVPVVGFDLPSTVELSAGTGAGLDALERAVADLFPQGSEEAEGSLLTNARQAEAAKRAARAVERACDALEMGVTPDALLTDVEEALGALGELTGKTVREDITSRIFERFCVGK